MDPGWWLEVSGQGFLSSVGWREPGPDPLMAAAEAATRLERAVTIHNPDCLRGKVGGDVCTCDPPPRIVHPAARA